MKTPEPKQETRKLKKKPLIKRNATPNQRNQSKKARITEEQTRHTQQLQKLDKLAPTRQEQPPQRPIVVEPTDMTLTLVKVIEKLYMHEAMNLVETIARPGAAIDLLQSMRKAGAKQIN